MKTRTISLISAAGFAALLSSCAFPLPANAAECAFTKAGVVASLTDNDEPFYDVPVADLPTVLASIKGYLGGNIEGITGAIFIVRQGVTYVGVERDGCFSPKPIPMIESPVS